MSPGEVVLVRFPEGERPGRKRRPAIIIAVLPSTSPTVLVCAISSNVLRRVDGWDIVVDQRHPDFRTSGLHVASVIRPSWLGTITDGEFRRLGHVSESTIRAINARIARVLLGGDGPQNGSGGV